jgi:hypothetical protein
MLFFPLLQCASLVKFPKKDFILQTRNKPQILVGITETKEYMKEMCEDGTIVLIWII